MKTLLIFLLILPSAVISLTAQCGFTVSTFPYQESFESNTGGWVSGGVNNDWAWGIPAKSIIQTAGDGSKCWITGGLNNSFYNYGERSYIESPCFNFSGLANPHIRFQIYVESEHINDGLTFQYSINNGVTWNNVGSTTDPVNCLNDNWFNQANVAALNTLASPLHGWSGNSLPNAGSCLGGNGSNGWIFAKHSMPYLAGQASVQFRFAFGAGNTCNDYDGIAIDDITIEDAAQGVQWVSVAPNNISCNGNNSGSINALASGGNGILTYHLAPVNLTNTNGTFNSLFAGNYTVSVSDANGCSISSAITLIQPSPIVFGSISKLNLQCHNDASGEINVLFNGGIGGLTYNLYPTGLSNTTGNFLGLAANNYTVVATDATGCTKTTTIGISQPPKIVLNQVTITQPGCNPNNDGIISVKASGGTGTLLYSIGGAYGPDSVFTNLTAANYTVSVKDANGCLLSTIAILVNLNAPVFNNVTVQHVDCFGGSNGQMTLTATGIAAIANYQAMPGNNSSIDGNFNTLMAGIYTITVSDINNCTNTTLVQINEPEKIQIENMSYTVGQCGSSLNAHVYTLASGGTGSLSYELKPGFILSSDGEFSNIQNPGIYTITVTDANQCSSSSTLLLAERICCDKLILPTVFSPNGDGKNDEFRVLNTKGVHVNEFIIYNRWGHTVFKSQNMNDSWDGKRFGTETEMGTYYYYIKYTCLSTLQEHLMKGDIVLVR